MAVRGDVSRLNFEGAVEVVMGGLGGYAINNFADGDPLYLGKVKADGIWLLVRFSLTSTVMAYANTSNNGGVASYAAAWSGRAGLTYGPYQTVTGI